MPIMSSKIYFYSIGSYTVYFCSPLRKKLSHKSLEEEIPEPVFLEVTREEEAEPDTRENHVILICSHTVEQDRPIYLPKYLHRYF